MRHLAKRRRVLEASLEKMRHLAKRRRVLEASLEILAGMEQWLWLQDYLALKEWLALYNRLDDEKATIRRIMSRYALRRRKNAPVH